MKITACKLQAVTSLLYLFALPFALPSLILLFNTSLCSLSPTLVLLLKQPQALTQPSPLLSAFLHL